MNYWIYDGTVERGPYTIDQLKQIGITPQTPVWHEGMSDWRRADMVPGLAPLFASGDDCQVCVEQPRELVVEVADETPADGFADGSVKNPAQPQYSAPMQPVTGAPAECPPSHLVWAVVVTVLFNTVMGAIAIYMSTKVQSRWNRGDLRGAWSASEATDWWIIGSIVVSIVTTPIALIAML